MRDEVLALPKTELHAALVAGAVINFAQHGDITLSENAEWRGTVEVSQDLWETNNR